MVKKDELLLREICSQNQSADPMSRSTLSEQVTIQVDKAKLPNFQMMSKSKEATQMPFSPLNALSADNTREMDFSDIPIFTENINIFPQTAFSATTTHLRPQQTPKRTGNEFQENGAIESFLYGDADEIALVPNQSDDRSIE